MMLSLLADCWSNYVVPVKKIHNLWVVTDHGDPILTRRPIDNKTAMGIL